MRKPRRIALALSIGIPHVERILRGILDYARAHGPWHFDFNPETGAVPVASLARWRGDGVIGMIPGALEERRAAALGFPAVNVSSAPLAPRLPAVTVDNAAVGAGAAELLLARGFRRFGYYGLGDVGYGRARGEGFAAVVERAGFACARFLDHGAADGREPWRWDRRRLGRWLARLEPPVGVLAVHDYRGRMLIEACAALGLRVPQDVAVVGVNDDPVACEFSEPSLTSIPIPGREIGWRAAALLDRLMRGRPAPAGPIRVPPAAPVLRGSTDVLAIADRPLADAVHLMGERLDLSIEQVADRVGLSRRSLELRFRRLLGTSPHEYLVRARVERARRLLLEARERIPLREVARRAGFSDLRRLNAACLRLLGERPRDLRRRAAAPAGPGLG